MPQALREEGLGRLRVKRAKPGIQSRLAAPGGLELVAKPETLAKIGDRLGYHPL